MILDMVFYKASIKVTFVPKMLYSIKAYAIYAEITNSFLLFFFII